MSMEEQRARQEDEARKAAAASVAETTPAEEGMVYQKCGFPFFQNSVFL